MKRLWILNLGAELELEGRGLSAAAQAKSKAQAQALAQTLVPRGDEWFIDDAEASRGITNGRAFLPTPAAVARLRDLGATIEAPAPELLSAANARTFATKHFPRPGVHMIRRDDELSGDEPRLLKRDLSFAGGGQRRIEGALSQADRRWLEASLKRGPVCVEPWYTIDIEVGVPGFVHRDGAIDVGTPVEQTVIKGQWRRSETSTTDLPEQALQASCHQAGQHLAGLGYFGPYNIDAHRSTEQGWTHVGEINARYTMGWALGWTAASRPDLRCEF